MLTIVTSHPIQYQVPIWRELARRGRIPIEVLFLSDHGLRPSLDTEFNKSFAWDIKLLEGYDSQIGHPGRSPSRFGSLHMSAAMFGHLRRIQPKAIWIQGWQLAGYWEGALAAKLLGAELWLRGETNLQSGARSRRIARGAALRGLFSLVSRFLCIGAANRAFYLAQGVDESRLALTPYCVDNARFRVSAERYRASRSAIRRNWSIPEDAFCFLFVGKFVGKKRPLDIIAAAAKLRFLAPGRKINLTWVGDGELERDARALVDAHFAASGGAITSSFIGFLNQSEIAKAYCAADCLVLPSEADETWGLVVNEAMACGLPAIVSDACGCAADLSMPEFENLIFSVGNVDALACSMASAMTRLPTAEAIAHKIEDFDIRRTVETVETLYLNAFS